jgi:diaminohydroxyphosphoribosylaminopyrimidine deaminase/5-amino-6-(5-phosphoribosylamino)uracil reductase
MVSGRGVERLKQAGIKVHFGLLAADCRRLIAPFAKHVSTGLPFVILKAAITLDGRMATVTGESRWITGAASRDHVHQVRDRVDAIMVGIGTVLRDDPRLTTRLPEGGGQDPLRVVVDSRLQVSEDAAVLNDGSRDRTLIATTEAAPTAKIDRLRNRGVRILTVGETAGQVDLRELLAELGREDIQSILLEGGSRLNHAVMTAGLVDRVMVYIAPKLLGGSDGVGMFSGAGPQFLHEAMTLTEVRVNRFGQDILVEGEVEKCSPA